MEFVKVDLFPTGCPSCHQPLPVFMEGYSVTNVFPRLILSQIMLEVNQIHDGHPCLHQAKIWSA